MTDALAKRIRNYLSSPDSPDVPITYQMLTIAMDLVPPNTIHRVTVALEHLIEQDADAGQPLIATFVISKARDGLPASGFFSCARDDFTVIRKAWMQSHSMRRNLNGPAHFGAQIPSQPIRQRF